MMTAKRNRTSARISAQAIVLVLVATLLVTSTFSTKASRTFQVNIDPGAYTGRYFFNCSFATELTGAQTFQLDPGSYWVDVGSHNVLSFTVDSSGQVTNINPAATAQAMGNTLRFNTTNVTINPGNYTGEYFPVSHIANASTGQQTFALVPALNYSVAVGGRGICTDIPFDVDAGGQVTSLASASAQASGSTLTFSNANIVINPGSYTGDYFPMGYPHPPLTDYKLSQLCPDSPTVLRLVGAASALA